MMRMMRGLMGSHKTSESTDDPKFGVGSFVIVPYGVLGTRMMANGAVVNKAPPPSVETCAFVDPAGLPYIQQFGPSGAGGAAGAIYRFLGISNDPAFPADVVEAVKATGQAKAHRYASGTCIHVVGPNFNLEPCGYDDARARLSLAYENVLREYAACDAPALRLLPISGGIFAGPFMRDVPQLTHDALQDACAHLAGTEPALVERLTKRRLELCIFAEGEWQGFITAGFAHVES